MEQPWRSGSKNARRRKVLLQLLLGTAGPWDAIIAITSAVARHLLQLF
jgi:hypothetical protein